MKKSVILLTVISVLIIAAVAYAQGHGMMWGGQGWNYCPYCGQYLGPGMMGGGYGMGPGMGPGMGGGMMGRGMIGPGYHGQSEACQKFLDETSGLRKDLHNKKYEYFEAIRNPKTTPESIVKLEKEIRDLQEKIYANAPQGCRWQ